MDGEGEEEYEETGEGVEDDGIYCTCQRRIDGVGGEMIGCDNDDCTIQWVSLSVFRASRDIRPEERRDTSEEKRC
jgi:hypothetical protein